MEDSKKKQIGREIYRQRVLHGLTQDKLGEAVGYSKQTISAWENGRLTPTDEAIESLKNLIHVDPILSVRNQTEEKEMCLSVKPLEELKTEKEVEGAINEILGKLPLQGENQFVIKYILKRLMFVGVAESLSYNRIGKMHNHEHIRPYSWLQTMDNITMGVSYENYTAEHNENNYRPSATVLRSELDSKWELISYGCYGPTENILDEEPDKIPLKGDDRDIVLKGERSLSELMEILPMNDNSIITSVLVYLSIIRDAVLEMET